MRRVRPSRFARSAIGELSEELGRGRSAAAGPTVELGAGSGLLTGVLVRAGVGVIAVELPGDARDQLTRSLPRVPVLSALASSLPFADGSVRAVLTTQVDAVTAAEVTDEVARVLVAGGALVLVAETDELAGFDDQAALDDRAGLGDPPPLDNGAGPDRGPRRGFDRPVRRSHPHQSADGRPSNTELVLWRRSP